jgi:hypothetical protein
MAAATGIRTVYFRAEKPAPILLIREERGRVRLCVNRLGCSYFDLGWGEARIEEMGKRLAHLVETVDPDAIPSILEAGIRGDVRTLFPALYQLEEQLRRIQDWVEKGPGVPLLKGRVFNIMPGRWLEVAGPVEAIGEPQINKVVEIATAFIVRSRAPSGARRREFEAWHEERDRIGAELYRTCLKSWFWTAAKAPAVERSRCRLY